jgi:TPR repeat protein
LSCGTPKAQMTLGHMLFSGVGIGPGHRAANEAGIGVRSDKLLARAWYRGSAKGGDFRGTYNCATVIVVEGCIARALHWFGRALFTVPAADRDDMVTALLSHRVGTVQALAAHASQSAGCAAAMKSA